MTSKNLIKIVIFAAFCLTFSIVQISAQSQSIYGEITGIITDSSDAVIPNATIKLIDENSGMEEITTSNERGVYKFAGS